VSRIGVIGPVAPNYFAENIGDSLRHLSAGTEPGLTARLGDAVTQRAHRDYTYDLRGAAIREKLS
jgi:hypothetical protein